MWGRGGASLPRLKHAVNLLFAAAVTLMCFAIPLVLEGREGIVGTAGDRSALVDALQRQPSGATAWEHFLGLALWLAGVPEGNVARAPRSRPHFSPKPPPPLPDTDVASLASRVWAEAPVVMAGTRAANGGAAMPATSPPLLFQIGANVSVRMRLRHPTHRIAFQHFALALVAGGGAARLVDGILASPHPLAPSTDRLAVVSVASAPHNAATWAMRLVAQSPPSPLPPGASAALRVSLIAPGGAHDHQRLREQLADNGCALAAAGVGGGAVHAACGAGTVALARPSEVLAEPAGGPLWHSARPACTGGGDAASVGPGAATTSATPLDRVHLASAASTSLVVVDSGPCGPHATAEAVRALLLDPPTDIVLLWYALPQGADGAPADMLVLAIEAAVARSVINATAVGPCAGAVGSWRWGLTKGVRGGLWERANPSKRPHDAPVCVLWLHRRDRAAVEVVLQTALAVRSSASAAHSSTRGKPVPGPGFDWFGVLLLTGGVGVGVALLRGVLRNWWAFGTPPPRRPRPRPPTAPPPPPTTATPV